MRLLASFVAFIPRAAGYVLIAALMVACLLGGALFLFAGQLLVLAEKISPKRPRTT